MSIRQLKTCAVYATRRRRCGANTSWRAPNRWRAARSATAGDEGVSEVMGTSLRAASTW